MKIASKHSAWIKSQIIVAVSVLHKDKVEIDDWKLL